MRLNVKFRAALLLLSVSAALGFVALLAHSLPAQTVQPVITEYKAKASGRFALINNTQDPMTVVLEPRSFSISPDGRGTFRPLDPGIKVELSTMSIQLQPMQTYYVFYKATAEAFPAWFTIYSTFSLARHGASLSVRIQLPHTVYLYQKKPLQKDGVHITSVVYSPTTHKLTCDLENVGRALGRAQQVHVTGPHGSNAAAAGFPLLPGMSRRLIVDWKDADPPTAITLEFERFSLKPPIVVEAGGGPVAAPVSTSKTNFEEPPTAPATRVIPGR